jgi:hypothetical protein
MLKPRCIYCGKIFDDKEKYETITKPVATTGANGGSKIIQKPVGFNCIKRCFKGQARAMFELYADVELKDGKLTEVKRPGMSGLALRRF